MTRAFASAAWTCSAKSFDELPLSVSLGRGGAHRRLVNPEQGLVPDLVDSNDIQMRGGSEPKRDEGEPVARKIVTASAALLIVSCGPETLRTEPSGAAGQMGASVTVKVFQFQPSPLDVRVGDTVTWTNEDDIEHTVTSGEPGNPDVGFDGSLNGTSATFKHRFEKSGTFPYFCSIHESMRGEIRVFGEGER